MPPTFSVIIPTHDRPHFLEGAVASALSQTVDDIEVIVVDDGSDPPASVPGDGRVSIVRRNRNRGPAAARNAGLAAASGEFVAFLDDDDLFTADRLEIALEGLARAPVALCFGKFLGATAGSHRVLDGWVADRILDSSTPSLGMTAVRRDIAPCFDERWSAIEDVEWWLRLSKIAAVRTVPRIGYLIRQHDARGHRNSLPARIRENEQFIAEHREYLAAHPAAEAFRWKRIGLMAQSIGDYKQARTAFRRSLRRHRDLATAAHLIKALHRRGRRASPAVRRPRRPSDHYPPRP